MSVFAHLPAILGKVNPVLAALWVVSSIVLAILLVCAWDRIGRRYQ